MRPSPLYNLKQGINRLRIKGGANPSSLYDLVNGWITVDGSIKPREGTIRAQTLDGTTKGLMADNGSFNVFSITQEAVPSGYVDNILINPNDATQPIDIIWFAKPFMGFPYVVAQFADGEVFHYWLQNSGTWTANTVYFTGTLILPTAPTGLAYLAQRVSAVNPTWQPETGISLNGIIEPTEYTGFQYKAVAVAGSSPHTGATEPVWPIIAGATIQEFGDFDTSATDAGTTQGTTPSTAQPLTTTITDRYGDSTTIANAGQSAGNTLTLPTVASTAVTVWAKGTLYAPGAVVQPSTGQGAFLNAIPNGDFENGNDGNWVLSSGVSFNNTNEYQGNECLQFTASHSDETATMNTFGLVTPGQSVTATAYVNPNNAGANLSMGINLRWYDAGDTFLSATAGARQEGGGYRLATVTGIAPANAAHCRVQLDGGNNTSSHTGFADLVSWNLATPAAVSNFLFEAIQATTGTSGSTEPTWPTVAGNTVVDNTVTWKAIGTSIITWEAIPIMQSGPTEPTWPTSVPLAVHDTSSFVDQNGATIDTSISWIASSRQVTDVKNPNTIGVALNSSHVFAIDKDIVDFSAAVDPTDWTSANNAGYLPTGLNNYGDNPAAVLTLYRSNLMVFNAGGYQMWQTDPDPANMAFLDAQPVGSIYTRAAQSVANDLLFLTEVGVRNLATVGATANMQVGSSGQPIDPLIKAQLKSGVEIAPLSQAFSILSNQAVVNPQPIALIESIEPFTTNTGQFSITSFHGTDPHATLSFTGGQGVLNTAALNNSTFCIDANMPLQIPQNFVSVDVVSAAPGVGFTFFTLEPGVFKDGNNAYSFEVALDASLNITGGNINQIVAGTKTALGSGQVSPSAGPVTSIGFGMVTQATGITEFSGWVKKSGGAWQLLVSISSTAFNFATIGNLANWFGGFSAWCNVGYTAVVDNLTFGRFGSVAMRDEEIVTHQDGSVYMPAPNTVMFTASSNDPAGLQYSGLWTLNLLTFAVEQVGVIWVTRGGLYANDLNMAIVLMDDGTAKVTSVTWGNFISGTFDLHINLSTLPDQSIVTNRQTILVSPTTLNLPGILSGTYGAYDGFLVFNAATNLWQLAYSITQQTSFAGSPFYAALATSPDLVTWTLVGADTANLGYEGTRQYQVNGKWYVLAGGPAGASTTARVYDSAMNFIGLLDAVFNGGAVTQPHPMVFALGSFFYLITFDDTRYASGSVHPFGNLILQRAQRSQAISSASPFPISLYYPGKGQYWLIFGSQAFVFTVNGQGLRTWSRYLFPDSITDWTLNGGILYMRTAGNLVWQLDEDTLVDDFGGSNTVFDGVIQTPYVDVGPLGLDKELIGIDLVGDGQVIIQIGWAQNDSTTFNDNPNFAQSLNVTPPFTIDAADTVPGEPIPFPMTAPSFTLILTFPGNQAWEWNASSLYLQDQSGTPTG